MGFSVLSVTLTASVLTSSENPLRRTDAHTWNGGFSVVRHQTLVHECRSPSSTIDNRPYAASCGMALGYGNDGDRLESLLDVPISGVG